MKFRSADFSGGNRSAVRARASRHAPGFTLLELAIVIFIMGLMLTLTMPYIGGFRRAQLRSQARRLAGRATYMFDQAAGHKLAFGLIFHITNPRYAAPSPHPPPSTPASPPTPPPPP